MAQSKRKCIRHKPTTSNSECSDDVEQEETISILSNLKSSCLPLQSQRIPTMPSTKTIETTNGTTHLSSISITGRKRISVSPEDTRFNRNRRFVGNFNAGICMNPNGHHMPLHIPHHVTHHLPPMTQTMCLGPNVMWSPHHIGMVGSPQYAAPLMHRFDTTSGKYVTMQTMHPPHQIPMHVPRYQIVFPHSTHHQSPIRMNGEAVDTIPDLPTSFNSPDTCGSIVTNALETNQKCIPLQPPIPSKCQGDIERIKKLPIPNFTNLVNYPSHMSQKQTPNLLRGMRCCVMCQQACPCVAGTKGKKLSDKDSESSGDTQKSGSDQDQNSEKNSGYAIIPSQNKGVCTQCDVKVWVVVVNGLEIKWCKGCKNFRPWVAFGDKGLATKCLRCRDRQREKYALQKEERDKTAVATKLLSLFS